MKPSAISTLALLSFTFQSLLTCSLPETIEPAHWKMHLELPLISQTIPVGNLLQKGADYGLGFGPSDTAISGDTIAIIRTDSLSYAFEQKIETPASSTLEQRLGVAMLQRMPQISIAFGLEQALPKSCRQGTALPPGTTLSLSEKGYMIPGVQSVSIDESSPPLTLTVVNRSGSLYMENIVIALMDKSDAAGAVHISSLPPHAIKTAVVSIAGKNLITPIALAVCVTLTKGSQIHPDDTLDIRFSFNNQVISEAVLNDTLIDFAAQLSGTIPLADSVKFDRIELGATTIGCEIKCPAQLKLEVTAAFTGMEEPDTFNTALQHTKRTARLEEDLCSTSTNLIRDTLFKLPGTSNGTLRVPLRKQCLYPFWNMRTQQSAIHYHFSIHSIPDGRMIHYRKNDLLKLQIQPVHFPIKRIDGCVTKSFSQTGTFKVNAGLAPTTSTAYVLQQALQFHKARLDVNIAPGLSPGSTLDSLALSITMRDQHGSSTPAATKQMLCAMTSFSHHLACMDFTGVFNTWPDTIIFDTRLTLPAGTALSFFNADSENDHSVPLFKLNPALIWKAAVPLCWKVTDTVHIELEKSTLSPDTTQLQWLNALDEPRVRVLIDVQNETNLGIRLFALGASGKHEKDLLACSIENARRIITADTLHEQLFSLLGKNGIRLQPRNSHTLDTVQFNELLTDAFFGYGRFCIRWFLDIPTSSTDALLATDFIKLSASGSIDGIGHTNPQGYDE